jgi:acyl-CoA synthetase (AMP-forming)/AMP-acid ligase II
MIKSQGFRVSPTEVEEAIFGSGLVSGVVVKGEPDAVSGTAIVAFCVPSDPATFRPEALIDYCKRELASYLVPRRVQVLESLPRLSSGKIDRKSVGG